MLFEILGNGSEIGHQARLIGEHNHEELILWICGFTELIDSVAHACHFVGHAATGIEDDPNRNRKVLARKVPDLLWLFTLKELEVLCVKAGHKSLRRVGHAHWHQNQSHICLNDVKQGTVYKRAGCDSIRHGRGCCPRSDVNIVQAGLGISCDTQKTQKKHNTNNSFQNSKCFPWGRHHSPPGKPAFHDSSACMRATSFHKTNLSAEPSLRICRVRPYFPAKDRAVSFTTLLRRP